MSVLEGLGQSGFVPYFLLLSFFTHLWRKIQTIGSFAAKTALTLKRVKMENRIMIPVKEIQVGDLLTFTMIESLFTGGKDTEEIVGVSINLVHRTVDLRTPGRAIFEIPMDMEIEIVRN
jgi:hypothetical protein